MSEGSQLLAQASAHDRAGREAEAIPLYQAAIRAGLGDEELPRAYLGLGSSLRVAGDAEEAVRTLREGVVRCPAHAPLRVFLAFALWERTPGEGLVEMVEAVLAAPASADLDGYSEPMRRYAAELAGR